MPTVNSYRTCVLYTVAGVVGFIVLGIDIPEEMERPRLRRDKI